MTRSAEWWAGWQEAIASACDASCKGCREALPIDPEQRGHYHKTGEGSWAVCMAQHILQAAEAFRQSAAERERQAALETRGWDGAEGGGDE